MALIFSSQEGQTVHKVAFLVFTRVTTSTNTGASQRKKEEMAGGSASSVVTSDEEVDADNSAEAEAHYPFCFMIFYD